MTNLMNEMIREALPQASANGYAFIHRETERGMVTLHALVVNTNTKNNQMTKRWKLNGKPIAAAKLTTA